MSIQLPDEPKLFSESPSNRYSRDCFVLKADVPKYAAHTLDMGSILRNLGYAIVDRQSVRGKEFRYAEGSDSYNNRSFSVWRSRLLEIAVNQTKPNELAIYYVQGRREEALKIAQGIRTSIIEDLRTKHRLHIQTIQMILYFQTLRKNFWI